MGGWMRLWVAISVLGAGWSAWNGLIDYRSNALDADQAYLEAAAQARRQDQCARQAPLPASRRGIAANNNCTLFKWQALPAFTQQLDQQRGQARAKALRDAVLSNLGLAALISTLSGLVLLGVRWIAQGFHRSA